MANSHRLIPLLTFVFLCVVLGVNANPKRIKEQELLKQLLDENKYDRRIRAYGLVDNDPTTVNINMYTRSIKVDDIKMELNVQLTFRMQWLDRRLNFESSLPAYSGYNFSYLTLDGSSSSKVWIPDVFFSNEKEGHLHTMLVPNTYIRIFPDGNVLWSQRISLKLSCPMILVRFPFDSQTCSIRMASYGWTNEDLAFKWKSQDPVQVTTDLHLPGFSLSEFTTDDCDSTTNTGTYSCLRVDFLFNRVRSWYLIQIFIPTSMMVILAWLSLWLDHREGTVRGFLSFLTLLVTAVLTAILNQSLPRVNYTKSIDVWTGIVNTFLFSALVEFVVINWMARREKGADSVVPIDADGDGFGKRKKGLSGMNGFNDLPMTEKIDFVFRIAYPCLFALFIIVYWGSYSG